MRSVSLRVSIRRRGPVNPDRWYPIEAEIEYKTIREAKGPVSGQGLTVKMSSAKILFKPGVPVDRGSILEVWVNWPARLENGVALRFYAQGEIRKSENGYALLEIFRHDYRIAPKA